MLTIHFYDKFIHTIAPDIESRSIAVTKVGTHVESWSSY